MSNPSHTTRLGARLHAELQALRELRSFWQLAWYQLRHSDAAANSNALESDWEELRCG